MQIVAILAQGEMGAGIAKRIASRGARVLTVLDGRSDASRRRAAEAGMEDSSWDALAQADLFLSILPPAQALALATQATGNWKGAERAPTYVDCNAVSPATVVQIEAAVAANGGKFVDAGIIGGPPRPGAEGPTLYASGPHASALASLRGLGLDIKILEGPIGAASALKMSYAGITKGMTAIGAIMALAAIRAGAGDDLKRELANSQPALSAWLNRQCKGMIPKSYRWVAEMEEIAAFQGDDATGGEIYRAIARFYERIAADEPGAKSETDQLRQWIR